MPTMPSWKLSHAGLVRAYTYKEGTLEIMKKHKKQLGKESTSPNTSPKATVTLGPKKQFRRNQQKRITTMSLREDSLVFERRSVPPALFLPKQEKKKSTRFYGLVCFHMLPLKEASEFSMAHDEGSNEERERLSIRGEREVQLVSEEERARPPSPPRHADAPSWRKRQSGLREALPSAFGKILQGGDGSVALIAMIAGGTLMVGAIAVTVFLCVAGYCEGGKSHQEQQKVYAGYPASAWWQRGAIYQAYPWSIADSDGDGYGDLEGLREKLSYMRELGIGAVWINPIFKSPMDDFGYDVSDYRSIDPIFGTMNDFDEFLASAHDEGLKFGTTGTRSLPFHWP